MPVGRTLLACLFLASCSLAADLRTLPGQSYSGDLVKITPKEVVINSGGKEQSVPVDQILEVTLNKDLKVALPAKYVDVELTDGSQFHCAGFALKGKNVNLDLPGGQKLTVPLEAVNSIIGEAHDTNLRGQYKQLAGKKRSSDLLVYIDQGELQTFDGTFGDATDDGTKISFDRNSKGEARDVPLEKIHGMLFLRSLPDNAPPAVCKVFDSAGSVLLAAEIEVKDDGYVVTTQAGVKVPYTKAVVSRFDYTRDKLVFLSDTEWVKWEKNVGTGFSEEVPAKNVLSVWQRQPLQLEGKRYDKGLSLRAGMSVEYDLKGDYREFSALVGVDDEMKKANPGLTEVKIECDGVTKKSVVVGRETKPIELALNVKDVQRLKIVLVCKEGAFDQGHQVSLVMAKVQK
jgi:hypothetical protein